MQVKQQSRPRARHILVHLSWALVSCTLSLAACSEAETPEQRIRALINEAEEAAENKQGRVLRSYISENYADGRGRDRRAVGGILRLYLLRHQAIHLLTRTTQVTFSEPERATAVVYVAMAGRPLADAAELARLRADFYRVDLGFAEEDGAWRVVRATWRPARPADFIYQ